MSRDNITNPGFVQGNLTRGRNN